MVRFGAAVADQRKQSAISSVDSSTLRTIQRNLIRRDGLFRRSRWWPWSALAVADFAHCAVWHHAVAARRSHPLYYLSHPGLAFRRFPAGRVSNPETVQMNVERIDVVRVGAAL